MRYVSFDSLTQLSNSIEAKNYLRTLWYKIEEAIIPTPLNYEQINKIQAEAPVGWDLTFDGSTFSLQHEFPCQGRLNISISPNGNIIYTIT